MRLLNGGAALLFWPDNGSECVFYFIMTALNLTGAHGADAKRIDTVIGGALCHVAKDGVIERISTSEFLGKEIDVYGSAEEPWFKAKDVAGWLELTNVTDMIRRVDKDEVAKFNLGSLSGETWFLSEDGLYEVLMQSRKPIARQFKKGVKRILKELRRKGTVTTAPLPSTYLESLKALVKAEEEKERLAIENKQQQLLIEEKTRQLDEAKDWFTIKRWAKMRCKDWRTYNWRRLKALSYELGYSVKKIFDANYGEVNIYHRNVFACYEQK